jgi:hypothetical protein
MVLGDPLVNEEAYMQQDGQELELSKDQQQD